MNKHFVRLCLIFLLTITFNSNRTFATPRASLTANQVTSLAVLAKTWGFLKYYHPKVAKGQYNWDSVLIAKTPVFLSAKNPKELNTCILNWLNELGQVDKCDTCDNTLTGRLSYNFDTAWISNSGFNPEVISKLQFILANRNQGNNHYVTYGASHQVKIINEATYSGAEFQFPSPEYRLLTLFRYWNIVNYFSPYKYITSRQWNNVLNELIPVFYNAKDTTQYHLSILKLIGALEDGHNGFTWSPPLLNYFGQYLRMPFVCSIVENKAVVTLIINDSLCKSQGIALNDVIIAVDGETIEERLHRFLPYVWNASNSEYAMQSFCSTFLFAGKTGTCEITRLRPEGKTEKVTINRYNSSIPDHDEEKPVSCKMLPGNIGYINMKYLLMKEAGAVMDSFSNTKGIIIDLRNYPNNRVWTAIAARLCTGKFLPVRMIYPDLSYPGLYKYYFDRLEGKENQQPYKGKVTILVNAFSKSHAEFSAMGLQAATKTITIGSTTAGADGDVIEHFPLPGRIYTWFSGLGVYYPDGTVAQKKGVKIDIICKPTIKGIQQGKDELLEKAISVIDGK